MYSQEFDQWADVTFGETGVQTHSKRSTPRIHTPMYSSLFFFFFFDHTAQLEGY